MKIQELMSTNVRSCRPETNLATVASLMWENDCGALPVVDNDNRVLGVVTDRDICLAVGTKNRLASEITVGEVISGKAHVCFQGDEVKLALKIMQEYAVRRLPVVDAEGVLQGMLSVRDVIINVDDSHKKKSLGISSEDAISTLRAISQT